MGEALPKGIRLLAGLFAVCAAFGQQQFFNNTLVVWANFGNNIGITPSNNDTTGYVALHGDTVVTNPSPTGSGNGEMRAASIKMTRINSGQPDACAGGVNCGGWDLFGIVAVTDYYGMDLPDDPYCASVFGAGVTKCIYGQMKTLTAELYFHAPVTPYVTNIATGFQSNLEVIEPGVTLVTFNGVVVNPPGVLNACVAAHDCGPTTQGSIDNFIGIYLADPTTGNANLTSGAAMQIQGLGQWGQILWANGGAIQVSSSGVLELDASTRVETGSMVSLWVGGSGADAGLQAGSIGIGGTTIIDGMQDIQVTGFIFTSQYIQANGNIQANVNGSPVDGVGFYINTTGVVTYSTALSAITIGNVYNVDAANEIVSSGHVGAGSGSGAGKGYYVGSDQIIDGSEDISVAGTVNTTAAGGYKLSGTTFANLNGSSQTQITIGGNVAADSGFTDQEGYYIGSGGGALGVLTYSTANSHANIQSIFNITTIANGSVVLSGTGHVGVGTGTAAGYYVGGLYVIDNAGDVAATNLSFTGTGPYIAGTNVTFTGAGNNVINASSSICGSTTQVLFNSSGSCGSSSSLTWSGTILTATQMASTGGTNFNTGGTNGAGLEMASILWATWNSSASLIDLSNINAVTAASDITITGNHHFGSNSGSNGGYFIGSDQVITGGEAISVSGIINTTAGSGYELSGTSFAKLDGSSHTQVTLGGNVSANGSATTSGGYYGGATGLITYDGTHYNIGNILDMTMLSGGFVQVQGAGYFQTGTSSGAGYWVSSTQVINNSADVAAHNLSFSGTGPYTMGFGVALSGSTLSGNYTNGTGVTLTNAVGTSVIIAIGQAVGTGASPTFAGLTDNGSLSVNNSLTVGGVGGNFSLDSSGNLSTSGYVAVNGGVYRINGNLGVNCSVGTLNPVTTIVAGGIVVHC